MGGVQTTAGIGEFAYAPASASASDSIRFGPGWRYFAARDDRSVQFGRTRAGQRVLTATSAPRAVGIQGRGNPGPWESTPK